MPKIGQYVDENKNGTGKSGLRDVKGNTHAPYVILVDPTTGDGIGGTTPVQVNLATALNSTTDSISIPSPTTISDGNKTVTTAGTAVTLSATSVPCRTVTITALLANTGVISVGGSTTTPSTTVRGVILAAGDSYTLDISNLNLIYINSTVNSEGVSYTYTV